MRPTIYGLLALSFAIAGTASAEILIKVDKSAQRMTVARDGEVLYRWPVSTGRNGYATPSGAHTAFRMEAAHFSKEWDNAPMPHSIFFTKLGHAIHGSYDIKRLGMPASHGCVRLSPANAASLYALVVKDGLANTKVVLSGSEQVALARVQERRMQQRPVRPDDPTEPQYVNHDAVDSGRYAQTDAAPAFYSNRIGGYQPPEYSSSSAFYRNDAFDQPSIVPENRRRFYRGPRGF